MLLAFFYFISVSYLFRQALNPATKPLQKLSYKTISSPFLNGLAISIKIYKIDFRIYYVISKFEKSLTHYLFSILAELLIVQCPIIR